MKIPYGTCDFSPIRSLGVLVAMSIVTVTRSGIAYEVEAPATDQVEQRLGLSATVSPFASISSLGGDGHMRDAKSGLFGVGADLTYGVRPIRYLQLGLGAGYQYYHELDESAAYAHGLEIPIHIGVVIPFGDRFELLAAGRIGYSQLWLLNQSDTESGSTLETSGIAAGPWLAGFLSVTRGLDLFLGVAAIWQFTSATNGKSYLDGVPVLGLNVPIGLGGRGRW